jgi:hypothetical protein
MTRKKKSGTAITDVALDAPAEAFGFAAEQIFPPEDGRIEPLPEGAPQLSLEKVIEALHDSEINVGLQSFADCGLRVWIGDELNGVDASARLESGKDGRWPGEGAVAFWLHDTVMNVISNSEYVARYGNDPSPLAAGQDPDTETRTFRPDRSA